MTQNDLNDSKWQECLKMTGMSQTDSKCLKMMQMTHNDQNDSKIVPNDSNDWNVLKWLQQLQMT